MKALYAMLNEIIIKQPMIAADEVTLNVTKEDKATKYMWQFCPASVSLKNKPVDTDISDIVLQGCNTI